MFTYESFPCAAICENGHVAIPEVEDPWGRMQPFCEHCGSAIITRCRHCDAGIPPITEIAKSYVAPHCCKGCGRPYPWRADELERTKRFIAEKAEVDQWNFAVTERVNELSEDIAAGCVTLPQLETTVNWLVQRAGDIMLAVVKEIVTSIAADGFKAEGLQLLAAMAGR